MIYIRKIFTQDLRDGKQIAFPKEPSNDFFHFNFTASDPDRSISFKYKVHDRASVYYELRDREIHTRLYAVSSEARIDGELKQFVRDSLKAKIDDILIFKRVNDSSFEFEYISKSSAEYSVVNSLLKNSNHSVAITHERNKEDLIEFETKCLQQIFYGAPGTGKSHKVKEITKGLNKTVVTFHPDTDYATFVGTYKPTLHEDGATITYGFVPQAFATAYVSAWKDTSRPHYLVIEEINRGNCAQIFGDIFQLLDRRADGYSDYVIDVDKDFADYIGRELSAVEVYRAKIVELAESAEIDENFSYSKIALPRNLHILATMNTSDQSLFPMDSAFKRRWDWEYMPINYAKASEYTIEIGDKKYNWGEFIEVVNLKIKEVNNSEDKQIGTFFVKAPDKIITFEQFRSKVMFYLWFEIYKDEAGTGDCIFKRNSTDDKGFSFGDLFSSDALDTLNDFMQYIGVKPDESVSVSAQNDVIESSSVE